MSEQRDHDMRFLAILAIAILMVLITLSAIGHEIQSREIRTLQHRQAILINAVDDLQQRIAVLEQERR